MASKEAKAPAVGGGEEAEAKEAVEKEKAPCFAFEFKLLKDKIGDKTTNKQIKSRVNESFMGWGAFDECRVIGDLGDDRRVIVFFARLFGKGQPAWDSLKKGETTTIEIYGESVALSASDESPSGGGATTGTSSRPKNPKSEAKKPSGRGRGRGEGKEGEGKDGDKKDGDKKEGRGRGKKEDVKGPSLQRGRANIGGKLGPVSKVRLAKIEKAKRDKENEERKARGEKPLDEPKKEEEPEPKKEEKGKGEKGKGEKGKGEKGKGEKGKEAGKGDGKKEAGKKGDAKKEAPKEAAKKGKGK